ncbi:uncharacterized protein LOC131162493 [Malania oleifera]|uniref:uncharacterized protein LOC131162493 n=1 Tax=Malania oleifera TaxID=397392 RepID=UPI0025AE3848|nr:uncharacterized protein LOC131162493 [Malania oleifera]
MADRKSYPSLPSNYVSLVQLQERWLQAKEREQREKEEEEKRAERRREQERLREERESRRLEKDDDHEASTEIQSRSVRRRPFQRKDWRRIGPRNDRRAAEGRYGKSEERGVGTEAVVQGSDREERLREERGNHNLKKDDNGGVGAAAEASTESQSSSVCSWPYGRERMAPTNDQRMVEVRYEKSEEKGVGPEAVLEGEGTGESKESKKKMKERGRKKNWKTLRRTDDEGAGGRAHLIPKGELEERIPVTVTAEKEEMKTIKRQIRQESENSEAGGKVLGEKARVHRVAAIEPKFDSLSMNDGYKRGNRGSMMNIDSRRWMDQGHGRISRSEVQKPRLSVRVWVRKGESSSDGNVS